MNEQLKSIATEEMQRIDLRSRAMLVVLHLSAFTCRKYDRKASKDTIDANNAQADAGRFNKKLIDTEKYLKPITKLQGEIRQFHYDNTLPWSEGHRVLNCSHHEHYAGAMNTYIDKHDRLVETFVEVWPQAVQEASELLGGMFKPGEYPPADIVRRKFDVVFDITPLPDAEDFRVELPQYVIDRTARRIEETYQAALNDAHKRLTGAIKDIAEKLPAWLSGQQKSFKDTLITNLEDIIELMPALNINNDPNLTFLASMAKRKLACYDPKLLREDKAEAQKVAQEAKNILARMNLGG